MVTDVITKNFDLFVKHKIADDENYLLIDKSKELHPIQFPFITNYDKRYVKRTDKKYVIGGNEYSIPIYVIDEKFIQKLSPDNIDCVKFWTMAMKHFPRYSLFGMDTVKMLTKDNLEYFKVQSLKIQEAMGTLTALDDGLTYNPKAKILEIGAGYGNLPDYIRNTYGSDEYYWGIDLKMLFWHDQLDLTDGWELPSNVTKQTYDIVYSFNVFRHLSRKQRRNYYKQIYKVLNKYGVFLFDMHIVCTENKDIEYLWSYLDKNNNKYLNFLNQFIRIDTIEDIVADATEFGFKVSTIRQLNTCYSIVFSKI